MFFYCLSNQKSIDFQEEFSYNNLSFRIKATILMLKVGGVHFGHPLIKD